MSTTTLTRPVTDTSVDVEVEIDHELGAKIGDEILVDVAKATKQKRVPGQPVRGRRSTESRAWSLGGNVD